MKRRMFFAAFCGLFTAWIWNVWRLVRDHWTAYRRGVQLR